MKKEINTEKEALKVKYNSVSNVPFPQASMTRSQREEQAFYESYSEHGFYLLKAIRLGIKVLGKIFKKLKNKVMLMLKEDDGQGV